MPLSSKGRKILRSMRRTYPDEDTAKRVFYASINKGTITGAEARRKPRPGRASVAGYRRRP